MEYLQEEEENERVFIKQCIEHIYTMLRDNVYHNSKLLKIAHEEAEKRKKANLDTLEKYRMNI